MLVEFCESQSKLCRQQFIYFFTSFLLQKQQGCQKPRPVIRSVMKDSRQGFHSNKTFLITYLGFHSTTSCWCCCRQCSIRPRTGGGDGGAVLCVTSHWLVSNKQRIKKLEPPWLRGTIVLKTSSASGPRCHILKR